MGALTHAPRHSTIVSVNSLSLVVSPSFIPAKKNLLSFLSCALNSTRNRASQGPAKLKITIKGVVASYCSPLKLKRKLLTPAILGKNMRRGNCVRDWLFVLTNQRQ